MGERKGERKGERGEREARTKKLSFWPNKSIGATSCGDFTL